MDTSTILNLISEGFEELNVGFKYKDEALKNIKEWLEGERFIDYKPQIIDMVESKKWDLLLDSFYQIIPFGTGGRRGLVGIGPNRINTITIESSAQGHSQYLITKYGEEDAKRRGVIIAYDVRQFLKKGVYNDDMPNPVMGLSCKDLAERAACVYAGNGVTTYLFTDFTTTPELSFTVRELKAVAGDMISASHNPPEFNGKKVVDETGGQLIPPLDEMLVKIVVEQVKNIEEIDFQEAVLKGLIKYVPASLHEEYIKACCKVAINPDNRGIKILFSPFHGTAYTSVFPVLQRLGFDIKLDEVSGKPDPQFSSIVFNIPNPEVIEAYRNLIPNADNSNSDIIVTADPDGDRIGLMSKEKDGWHFFNGNEIFVMAVCYMLEEYTKLGMLDPNKIVVKTLVTSNILELITKDYNVQIISNLLVGIKYIAEEMNKLDREGKINSFLIGGEESHGMVAGNYIRDKDTCVPAILISELASREKKLGRTLGEYLNLVYQKYGYFRNYLTELRLPGAEGMENMAKIQAFLRYNKPVKIGNFEVSNIKDYWDGEPFSSETDRVSRNVLVLSLIPDSATHSIIATIRPSGTEPKTKIYFEIGRKPLGENSDIEKERLEVENILLELEKDIIKYLYKILDIDFPDRGFLLFWQLPVTEKMKYFEIEAQIVALKDVQDRVERERELSKLLEFLGADPIDKVDRAFKAEYHQNIKEFLNLS